MTKDIYDPRSPSATISLRDSEREGPFVDDPPANKSSQKASKHSSTERSGPEQRERRPHDQQPQNPQGQSARPKQGGREAHSRASEKLKNSPTAQFEYGRASQHSTERYARGSRRLEHGNPDVGEVDLGNIEADRPADPDDTDPFD